MLSSVPQRTLAQSENPFPVSIVFINAMTSQSEIDVFINGAGREERMIEGLPYGEVSEVFEGSAPVTGIVVKQNRRFGIDRWLFNTIMPAEAGRSYLVVISDFVITPVQISNVALSDDMARARLIHAAAQAPAVDIFVNGEMAFENLRYGLATDAGELPPGSYSISLNATGTDTTALQVDGVELEAGMLYAFVAIGIPGSTDQPLTVVVASAPGEGLVPMVDGSPEPEGTPTS
jgi:hypothetical protein